VEIVISSGHGKLVRGAAGYLDEVDEARRFVEALADNLRKVGVSVNTFHDDKSTTQSENLETIVQFHNNYVRDLDVSVHFNAYQTTSHPMGTECLYMTQKEIAVEVAQAIADAGGFINRGAKYRDDLYFLNQTEAPAILIEVCFVDSKADADLYNEHFTDIVFMLASVAKPTDPEYQS
jgi:N-acetylmuramoyl-L-alanine amidase